MKFLGHMAGTKSLAWAVVALMGLGFGTSARADLVLGIASVANSDVAFTGTGSSASFTFSSQGFEVTSSSGTGSAVGLDGKIGGTFSYSSVSSPFSGLQTANLSTTGGTISITDASNHTLTASIAGLDISTFGTGVTVNVNGDINLSNVQYSGTNADLLALKADANANGGVFTLTFQFTPAESLTKLEAVGTHKSTYSGSIDASSLGVASVPEPSSLALGCIGLSFVIGYRIRRRKATAA